VTQAEGRVAVSVHAVDRASPNDAGPTLLLFAVGSTEHAVACVTTSPKRPSSDSRSEQDSSAQILTVAYRPSVQLKAMTGSSTSG